MNSEFDVQVSYLQDICKQSSIDSQRLFAEIRLLRDQMKLLQTHIENKNENIMKEMGPRIEQLEQKIEINWRNIQNMDKVAWDQLDKEKKIFQDCEKIVQEMEFRIDQVNRKV